jgi:Alcohol dehydrogenase, class IV
MHNQDKKEGRKMKPFGIVPSITEYADFASYAKEAKLGKQDLILTNEYIYRPVIADLELGCQTLFQEEFGGGEPTDEMVNAILDALREMKYTRIIAVGGGTIIDIAKVLAVAAPQDSVDDLYDKMASGLTKVHPLTIVPTTCGTGSEVTNISIINRISRGVKQGIVSESMFADEAVLIPGMLMSLPYGVFATSSIDAMIHAVESYLSPNACSLSELFSVEALHLILQGWQRAVKEGGKDAWKSNASEFLRASNYAGIAFGHAGCAAVHAMAYPLGSVHHIPHGQANQLMFADVMRKYAEKQSDGKLADLSAILGKELGAAEKDGLNALYKLMDDVLKKEPLRAHGVTEEELPVFAKNVIETQQRLLGNNFVPLSEDEILEIYRNAF